ncbi:hypothetical protein CEK26_009132 [Fusarium fujikuroi]|nr:hypothetical protein CEK27_009152 [Fusarium fujikuroi]QGI82433.1 hypothetical protein CEK25_009162 [Fusarium fujikuroi]QGI96063.1 hypothetical protein CEK26_009132 [Fusarium fujikuroi]
MPSGSCTKTNQGAAEWSCEHDIKLELINDKGKFEDALRVIYPLGFKVNYKYSPSTCRVIALAKTTDPTDLCRSNRPTESAEKEFFLNADVGDIPVVVVFTQFDTLVDDHFCQLRRRQRNRTKAVDMDQLEKDAMNFAIADYDSNYRGQFEREFGRRLRVAIIQLSMPQPEDGEPMETSGVDSLVKDTRGMLLADGLKLLWTAAQCHSADMKLKESINLGMDVFWKAVGTSSIPFIPFVGATALYSAFIKILKIINTIWGIPSCTPLLHDSKVRNLFLQGCFDASAGDILTSKFLVALNFFGPLTATQTFTVILKMIAGIYLLHEKLFWYIKNHPERVVSPATIGRMVMEFRRSQ